VTLHPQKKIYFLIFLMIGLFQHYSVAQQRCSAVESEATRLAKYKNLHSKADFEKWVAKKINDRRNMLVPFGTNGTGDPVKIAIVVHVIHNNEPYGTGVNITDEQIYSQIEVLNEDFNRQNADTVNTQPEFRPLGSKLNVEFVLARQTETGEPTNGIVRVQGTKSSYNINIADRELLSSISQWNPNIYLNIWVTNLTSPNIGLAQFPDYNYPGLDDQPNTSNPNTDGLVIDYKVFGSEAKIPGLGLMPAYNRGRTTTHEIGHFFGLRHVWGDDTSASGCFVDDYVDDTPGSNKDYSGVCTPTDHFSCNSNDMFENYLYYTNDACMNIFTKEQVGRMEVILDNAIRRASLKNSIGTEYPDNQFIDITISSISSPGKVVCENTIAPAIMVKNNGEQPIKNFTVAYAINGSDLQYNYTGDTIFSGKTVEIVFPQTEAPAGTNFFSARILDLPGEQSVANNYKESYFEIDQQTDFIPLREQFLTENIESTNWITLNEDNKIGWETETAPKNNNANIAAFINLYNYEERQQLDWLISPALDFTDISAASLFFKVSYAKNADFNDQLYVMASENCGNSFDEILEVYSPSDLASVESEAFWAPKNSGDWLTKSLDLSSLAGKDNVRLAFMTVNNYGNNLYLDDIEFYANAPDEVIAVGQSSFVVYPNPSMNGRFQMAFNTSKRQLVSIQIMDVMGRVIYNGDFANTLNQTYDFELVNARSGMYIIVAQGEDFIRSKKLMLGE